MTGLSVAVSACHARSGTEGSRLQENDVAENNAVVSGGNATLAEDPSLKGNEIVVHEYGDEQGAPAEPPQSVAAPRHLTGAAIRRALAGHELSDGVHWSWKFNPGGKLQSEENGKRMAGRWRIDGDQLCIDAGYGDTCHAVTRQGNSIQLWRNGAVAVEAELQ